MSHVLKLLEIAEERGVDLQYAPDYAEPGYDCEKGVILGNWNDQTASRIGKLLEKLGFELEWEDEWITCSDCGNALRCQPDCYSWQMSGAILDGECLCLCCILSDPEPVLEYYRGNPDMAITFDIDFEALGYTRYHKKGYRNEFLPDQDDNPHEIAKKLREQGITDFVFKIDGCGQFDMAFSVWSNKTRKGCHNEADYRM